jgi:hypothetical protein
MAILPKGGGVEKSTSESDPAIDAICDGIKFFVETLH